MSGATESLAENIDSGDLEGVVRAMKALAVSSIGQYERSVRRSATTIGLSNWDFAVPAQARPASLRLPRLTRT